MIRASIQIRPGWLALIGRNVNASNGANAFNQIA
jgi:hypothetical protein